jgi:hypothetical protein
MNLTTKLLLGFGLSAGFLGFSQDLSKINPVLTGAPFLRISPDARAGGMGDQGVASSPDAFSQFWNAAKYPFSKTSSSVGLSFTPYMSKLTSDTYLMYAAFHKFLGQDERSTISASIYYFNMGQVDLTQLVGSEVTSMGTSKPNEFSIDVAYALKLSDSYSMAVTGRFIRSDLAGGFNTDTTLKPANSFAVDVSGYYSSPKFSSFGGYDGKVNAGLAIQNLGPKLDYTGNEESRSYLPTMARLGIGYDMYLDDMNKIGLSVEGSKILVPGSEFVGMDPNTRQPIYKVPNVGPIQGITKSFKNPNSIMYSGALEYSYDNAFAVRTGYFHESEEQGARQYATAGIGLKYRSFGLDISYLINMSKINTALGENGRG